MKLFRQIKLHVLLSVHTGLYLRKDSAGAFLKGIAEWPKGKREKFFPTHLSLCVGCALYT